MSLYAKPIRYAQKKHLKYVWEFSPDSKREGKAKGIDGQTAESFKAHLPTNIDIIHKTLTTGDYSFSPLKAIFKDKGNGKYRIICIPTVKDRLVQRLIAYHLLGKYNPKTQTFVDKFNLVTSVSYGIGNGRKDHYQIAIEEAVRKRDALPWVLKTDISAFFDNIDRIKIFAKVEKHLEKKSSLLPLLKGVINCEISKKTWKSDGDKLKDQGINKEVGLRQGMPLSPLLSNFFLADFDRKMIKKGLNIIRYADDIIVFSSSECECMVAQTIIETALSDIGLDIPSLGNIETSKTFICRPEEPVLFLGVHIKKHAGKYIQAIPKKTRDDILNSLDSYKDMSFCLSKKLNFPGVSDYLIKKLDGYMASYKNTENKDKFKALYEQKYNKVIKSLLENIFSPEVIKRLDDKKKRFIGLPPENIPLKKDKNQSNNCSADNTKQVKEVMSA